MNAKAENQVITSNTFNTLKVLNGKTKLRFKNGLYRLLKKNNTSF